MKTMNDLYGDGSDHISCDDCGWCLTCGDCHCVPPKPSVLQPSVQVLSTNEQKPLDPSVLLETLQREEFKERDVL